MANHPKCHLTQTPLILLSYTAALVAFCTLTLPLLASSQTIAFDRTCLGVKKLQLCVGAKAPKHGNSVSLVAIGGAMNPSRALIHNSEDISGPLPTNFGFSKLSHLALANNKLTGPIPPSVGQLHDTLLEIVLLNNQLSGCLPHELGMLDKAVVIDAGENRLTGPIPSSFSCLGRVEQLNLAGNRLYGRIPEALCKLAGPDNGHLSNLTLSGNYLTAVGPACAALIKEGVLDVKNNCIPGFANQRRPAECVAFQSQPKTCPEVSTHQVSCPAAASRNAAAPEERKARDYYSYLTYASLRQ